MKIKLYPSQYGGLALRKMAGALTYCQNPRLRALALPVVYHLGCSSIRIPLEVIAGECRMNGSLWG